MTNLNEIIEILNDVLKQNLDYGYTESDVYRLQGKRDLAEEILNLIEYNNKLQFKGINPEHSNLNDDLS